MWPLVVACVCVYLALRYYLRSLRISSYTDKYVVISGCDTGFGNLLAKRLNNLGFQVIAGCLTDAGIEEVTSASSGQIAALKLDITDPKVVQGFADKVKAILPENAGLWALVNSAGILGPAGMLDYTSKEDFRKVMEVNLFGHIAMVNTFLPLLRRSQGRIVMLSSTAGRVVVPPFFCYAVSKFALEGYSDGLRVQLASSRVSVHIIEPSGNRTPMTENSAICSSIHSSFARASSDVKRFYGEDFPVKLSAIFTNPYLEKVGLPGPEPAVAATEHAVTARHPRARYIVGVLGSIFWLVSFLPECVGDFMVSQRLPRPAGL